MLTNPAGSFTTPAATLDVFAITTSSLPTATAGVAYRVQLRADGGPGPYRWSCAGRLPKGLTLTAKGLLTGKPKAAKKNAGTPTTYTLTMSATTAASAGQPALSTSQVLSLVVQAPDQSDD